VIDLETSRSGRVEGVRICELDRPGVVGWLSADVVVDAAGRCSRTAAWLGRAAMPLQLSQERLHAVFVSRGVRLGSRSEQGEPPLGVRRMGPRTVAVARVGREVGPEVAGSGWVVTLGGYDGERPPTEAARFTTWIAPVWPDLAERLSSMEVDADAMVCRIPAAVRRHYERMRTVPPGLLAVGDALRAPDPMEETGLATSAAQGHLLRAVLSGRAAAEAGPLFFAACAEGDATAGTTAALSA
jgi:hypothetical protein